VAIHSAPRWPGHTLGRCSCGVALVRWWFFWGWRPDGFVVDCRGAARLAVTGGGDLSGASPKRYKYCDVGGIGNPAILRDRGWTAAALVRLAVTESWGD
jgi:hypothetical protein